MRRNSDAVVAQVAARQRGLVTRAELLKAGLDDDAILHRVKRGRLRRVFRGVYLVDHPVAGPPLARELAALLACGPTAALSHHTAVALWRILPSVSGPIHVIVPGPRRRSRPGLRVHRQPLPDGDVRIKAGLRLTSAARTLTDLAPFLDRPTLERATDEAQVLGLATAEELGLKDDGVTRSDAERRLRALLRRADLCPDRFNTRLHGHLVDALFVNAKLALEVDGHQFHRTRRRFESDRRRDAELAAHGYLVLRITWKQTTAEPEATVARIAATKATREARR